jgi:hypothetical protein
MRQFLLQFLRFSRTDNALSQTASAPATKDSATKTKNLFPASITLTPCLTSDTEIG